MHFPKKKVILVTGSDGQLGKEFRHFASTQNIFEFLFTNRSTLDITDSSAVQNIFQKFRPDFCINCAAYTAVDNAELEQEMAFLINEIGVRNLSKACTNYDSFLIHISTDYVYDSIYGSPISEDAECTPRSVYGKSKRAGEKILENSHGEWLCLRVSWLYSSFNKNFVKTMIQLAEQRDILSIVSDQHGTPTYARDLAESIIHIIEDEALQTKCNSFYNYSNQEATTWALFAKEIFRQTGQNCIVQDVTTAEYNARAPRPLWSVLNLNKTQTTFDIDPPVWQASLRKCIDLLTS